MDNTPSSRSGSAASSQSIRSDTSSQSTRFDTSSATSGGTAQDLRGKAGEAASKIAEVAQQAGTQAKEAAAETADSVRAMSDSVEDSLRDFIENKPYTTAAIALAVGWIIGRAHRPF